MKKNSLLQIELDKGIITDLRAKKAYVAQSFPKFMQELIEAGGLMQWVRKKHTR